MSQFDPADSQALPEPDSEAQQRSKQLQALIAEACVSGLPSDPDIPDTSNAGTGWMPFSKYMEMALYQPGLGYYSGGLQKFGEQGDFITAPEVSPLFAQCFASQCRQAMHAFLADGTIRSVDIVEFGAGSGVFAADLLSELNVLACLPTRYYILELSAELRQRQAARIKQACPELASRVVWLDALPDKLDCAIVIANEVVDAMPVEVFRVNQSGLEMLYVGEQDGRLVSSFQAASNTVQDRLAEIDRRSGLEIQQRHDYQSEVNLAAAGWLASLNACVENLLCFVVDYGYNEQEYYHPDRSQGSLMCYYRHRAHADTLWWPGIQDITAFVNFTDLAYAADAIGMDVAGFTTQAAFLLSNGLSERHQQLVTDDVQQQVRLSQQVKTLTLPSEMGERFKVLALAKNVDSPISGFAMLDLRNRL